MEYFAGYGFNKSHSTAYAFLAYQTAYLKANYPWHFTAALLSIESQNTDKLALYLSEARERGIPVLAPDINHSQLRFSVEPGIGVRFGLTAIKALGRRPSKQFSPPGSPSAAAFPRSTRFARCSIFGW
jgi:DNA polymerase-3 subunit alpha